MDIVDGHGCGLVIALFHHQNVRDILSEIPQALGPCQATPPPIRSSASTLTAINRPLPTRPMRFRLTLPGYELVTAKSGYPLLLPGAPQRPFPSHDPIDPCFIPARDRHVHRPIVLAPGITKGANGGCSREAKTQVTENLIPSDIQPITLVPDIKRLRTNPSHNRSRRIRVLSTSDHLCRRRRLFINDITRLGGSAQQGQTGKSNKGNCSFHDGSPLFCLA